MTAREVEDFGADCYNRHEICLLEHKNDSAAYYLELRADADTLNLEWQSDAGRFIEVYLADYNKALFYFNRILSACGVKGDNNYWGAVSYSNIGSIYFSHGYYNQALEYYEKALKICVDIFGENHPSVGTIYDEIMLTYWTAKSKGEVLPGFDEFASERVFVGNILPGDTPAGQQGMSGEYVILDFGDWNIDSESSLLDKNEELRSKPKTITVMQGGKISQYHFENTIGMQFSYKKVGKAERERIVAEYRKWKAQAGR